MNSVPDKTTEFLKQLCTNYRPEEIKKKTESKYQFEFSNIKRILQSVKISLKTQNCLPHAQVSRINHQ